MRTSLNNIKQAEEFLRGIMPKDEALVFEAHLLVNPEMGADVERQALVYRLVRLYGRRSMRLRLEKLQRRIFSDPDKRNFCENILKNFGIG